MHAAEVVNWCALLLAAAPLAPAVAQSWSLEAYVGSAYNFRNRLEITQDGGFSRSLSANYDTRGFETPLYYLVRAGRWETRAGWELSLLHHKLYLTNPPAGVASLSISHGFNVLALSRAFRYGNWLYRIGAGPVITHAEANINGVTYDGPYKLAGAALVTGIGRRFYIGASTFVSVEAMLTAARATPKLPGPPDAELKVNNVALHFLAGIGREF